MKYWLQQVFQGPSQSLVTKRTTRLWHEYFGSRYSTSLVSHARLDPDTDISAAGNPEAYVSATQFDFDANISATGNPEA